jgi:CHAT domain-containing protein
VARFRTLIEQRSPDAQKAARELFELLLAPASTQLNGKKLLTIAPDASLWELPFQALRPTDGRYLVEDHAISYAPSLTALRDMSRPLFSSAGSGRMAQLVAFGDPELTAETVSRVGRLSEDGKFGMKRPAETEFKSLIQIYPPQQSRVYTGGDASEERLKLQTGRGRILQLSLRTILSDTNPLHSPTLMAVADSNRKEDGLLHPWEIAGLNLRTDIVVMSACEPASSGAGGGEAMTGLAWAWLAAGSPTLFLNQGTWEVDEAGVLPELHRNLRQARPAEALRRSVLKILKGQYADPIYWSRFIMVGTK